MSAAADYLLHVEEILKKTIATQEESLLKAADMVTDSCLNNGRFYVLGSGHSHMIAEEIYIRAGGLAYVKAILPPELMLHEMPLGAKERGCGVIAMTSLEHSRNTSSRHKSGKKLYEIADVILDNGACKGDAGFYIEGFDVPTGPTSDTIGTALAQALIAQTIQDLVQKGMKPPVFKSSNIDGADEYNDALFDKYYGYWK